MNELYKKSIRILELPRVLEMLSEHAVCSEAKSRALAIEPTSDLFEAKKRMEETNAAVRLISLKGGASFSQIGDIRASLRRAEMGGMLSMPALLEIGTFLSSVRRVKAYLDDDSCVDTCLDWLFSRLFPDKHLEERINTSILSEDEMADGASRDLSDIRRKIRASNSRIRETLQHIISSPAYSSYLQDAIITQRSGRFVVPVKSEHKNSISGLVHDMSSSGSTFFIEPMQVVSLNNEIRELEVKEKQEIDRILAEMSAEVADFAERLGESWEALVSLDLIFAKGQFAYRIKANEPILTEDHAVDLKRARHPLIDPRKVVPISVSLGGEFDTLIVTGPNTGGKTVTLKTIGLLSLMAMCGLHIPADCESRVSVFEGIYADIGDEQSIEQSLSTFSSHMTNIVSILGAADAGCLLLFDELGAGTDPIEGAALAIAIILHARSLGTRIAATTHYAELKEFALSTPGVRNASCEFDVATLMPTYKLLIGVPGSSNAFAISRRLGLPEEIIDSARGLIDSESLKFEDILSSLERERKTLETARIEAEKIRRDAEETARKARKYHSDAEKEKNRAKERANAEAQRIISDARAEAESIINELDALRRRQQNDDTAEALNRARSELRGRLNKAESAFRTPERKVVSKTTHPLREGELVKLLNYGTTATVLTPPDENGNLTVQAGIMRVTLKRTEVEPVETRPEQPSGYIVLPKKESIATRSIRNELDLRGMTVSEALLDLDKYIDEALLSNLHTVTIIHGKGTGALRTAVTDSLRKDPRVKSSRPGKYGEGEIGVTVVEL